MMKSKTARASKTYPNTRDVAYLHVSELIPNPRNPRLHGSEVMQLARTILRTAWGAPIVVQESTGMVIAGHGRLEAAHAIMTGIEIDGVVRGGPDHEFDSRAPCAGYVPVRVIDVSDATADAMMAADNAEALQGSDDLAKMQALLSSVSASIRSDIGLDIQAMSAAISSAADAILKDSPLDPSALPPSEGVAVEDNDAEWEGMPEFVSDDHRPNSSLIVHFRNDDDERAFLELINSTIIKGFSKTRSAWYPDLTDKERVIGNKDREFEYK
jgi:hypothetical protein